jgi:hypothetical protein
MQHPKCRTCGERHQFGPCPQAAASKPVNAPPVSLTAAPVSLTPTPAAPVSLTPDRAKFDRVSYQRDYMRRQRAAKRATPAS